MNWLLGAMLLLMPLTADAQRVFVYDPDNVLWPNVACQGGSRIGLPPGSVMPLLCQIVDPTPNTRIILLTMP